MPSLQDIRKRIGSVKNTEQLTKAMKMVAAAKLRRAQEAVENARPYAKSLDDVIGLVVAGIEDADHALLVEREEVKKIDLVVIASDRGLCGGYNANVFRRADAHIKQMREAGVEVSLVPVGKRSFDFYRKKFEGPRIVDSFVDIASSMAYGTAEQIGELVTRRFLEGDSDKVEVIYTGFISVMNQKVTLYSLLPLPRPEPLEDEGAVLEHKYEPNREQLLNEMLPRQVLVQILRALLESVASEHGARMTAMDSASTNAAEMIDRLTLQMNRARQAIITTELMEIVSGKEALEG